MLFQTSSIPTSQITSNSAHFITGSFVGAVDGLANPLQSSIILQLRLVPSDSSDSSYEITGKCVRAHAELFSSSPIDLHLRIMPMKMPECSSKFVCNDVKSVTSCDNLTEPHQPSHCPVNLDQLSTSKSSAELSLNNPEINNGKVGLACARRPDESIATATVMTTTSCREQSQPSRNQL